MPVTKKVICHGLAHRTHEEHIYEKIRNMAQSDKEGITLYDENSAYRSERNTDVCESIRHGNGYENVPVKHEFSEEVKI